MEDDADDDDDDDEARKNGMVYVSVVPLRLRDYDESRMSWY
jgi:hypothetical protein